MNVTRLRRDQGNEQGHHSSLVLDAAYQIIELGTFLRSKAVIMAIVLAFIPISDPWAGGARSWWGAPRIIWCFFGWPGERPR